MVGMTPSRSSPCSGLPCGAGEVGQFLGLAKDAQRLLRDPRAQSGVKRTTRRVRSTKVMPSRVSSSRKPADKVDCVTKQASAARPKWPCCSERHQILKLLDASGGGTVIDNSNQSHRYNRLERLEPAT